ncbi:MAG TPA: DUF433 domain-containing protein [Burkholderiales bacterium]|nr:DUF433 domain-containing protein [Burkholderiales bacterium]
MCADFDAVSDGYGRDGSVITGHPQRAQPAEDLPAYTLARAGQIVRLPPSTLRLWARGAGQHKPLFKPALQLPTTLSFLNLVEAFVLASMRRVHGVSMQRVRSALKFIADELDVRRPLVHTSFRTDGVALFVQHAGRLLEVPGKRQELLQHVLDASLQRIEWGGDVAERLYPWVRADLEAAQPRSIVVDPRRGFGQPVIAGTGIQARIVAARYRAGESIATLADDYAVAIDKIEDAIRCETREAA